MLDRLVLWRDYLDLPLNEDGSLTDIAYFQQKLIGSLRVPIYVILGLTEEEWILKRLIMSDADIENDLERHSNMSYQLERRRWVKS
jgi:hypothetical protein